MRGATQGDANRPALGWNRSTHREPPDNREITNWCYYLGPEAQNLVATVVGIGSIWRVEVAPPVGQRVHPFQRILELYGSDEEEAKFEAELLLHRFGHVQTAGDAPIQDAA